jgi:hypothetical protein
MTKNGFALVLVLLFSLFILVAVVATTFLRSFTARNALSNEEASYQALLLAESGLDTLVTRFSLSNPKPAISFPDTPASGEAAQTLQLGSLATLSLGSHRALLEAAAVTTANGTRFVRVRSRGQVMLGSAVVAERVVSSDFNALYGGAGFGNAPAAITSVATVGNLGNMTSMGVATDAVMAAATGDVILIDPIGSGNAATATQLDVKVNTNQRFVIGRTVVRGSQKYTVLGLRKTGNSEYVRLESLSVPHIQFTQAAAQAAFPAGGSFIPYEYWTTESLVLGAGTSGAQLPLNSIAGFRVDLLAPQPLTLQAGGRTFTGRVTQVDGAAQQVSVEWSAVLSSSTTVPANTRVDTVIPAVLSAGTISAGGSAVTEPNVVANSGFFPTDRNQVFQAFFGLTPDDLRTAPGVRVVSPGTFSPVTSSYMPDRVIFVEGGLRLTGTPLLCGDASGQILIVDGDLTLNNAGCDNPLDRNNKLPFKGIIYVRGNLDLQGTPLVDGAIFVEALATNSIRVTGTPVVRYDPFLINSLSETIPSIPGLALIPGTWRVY